MADYILRGIDDKLWREVKAIAALQGMTVKDLIIKTILSEQMESEQEKRIEDSHK
jgi:hypothetical protein